MYYRWTPAVMSVFSVLCRFAGEPLSRRDIAKHAGVSPMSASNGVTMLASEGLVTIVRIKTTDQVALDLSNHRAVALKRAENLTRIALSGLVEACERTAPGSTIILFGSYSFGEDISTSDIDVAIIGRSSVDFDGSRFETELFRPVHVSAFESWMHIDTHLRNSILSGIVLSGRVTLETP